MTLWLWQAGCAIFWLTVVWLQAAPSYQHDFTKLLFSNYLERSIHAAPSYQEHFTKLLFSNYLERRIHAAPSYQDHFTKLLFSNYLERSIHAPQRDAAIQLTDIFFLLGLSAILQSHISSDFNMSQVITAQSWLFTQYSMPCQTKS